VSTRIIFDPVKILGDLDSGACRFGPRDPVDRALFSSACLCDGERACLLLRFACWQVACCLLLLPILLLSTDRYFEFVSVGYRSFQIVFALPTVFAAGMFLCSSSRLRIVSWPFCVYLIVRFCRRHFKISEGRSRFSWIYKLSVDRLRKELSRRKLDVDGDVTILHERLLRYELDTVPSGSPSER